MSALLPIIAVSGATSLAMTAANPILNAANQDANKILPMTKPDPNTLFTLMHRKIIDEKTYLELMRTWGYQPHFAQQMLAGNMQLIGINEAITLFRRGKLGSANETPTQNFRRILKENGLGAKIADQLLTATEIIANEQQLITFMVREVFNDEIRTKFGQDLEFPDDIAGNITKILPEFAKIGIQETLARRLWAAHWELPQFQTAAEALHRYHKDDLDFWKDEVEQMGLDPQEVAMEQDTIATLLKTRDVMPFWRPKEQATQFKNLGRIETRWFVRFRFVELKEATYLYKRLGLPENMARRVAQVVFAVQSITDWKLAVRQGAMTFADIEKELNEWQITDQKIIDVVRRKVAPDELESVTKYREISLSKVIKAFKNDQITRIQAIDFIKKLKYEDETAKFILEVETFEDDLMPPKKQRDLTKADIMAAYRVDSLTRAESKQRLTELRFSVDEAELLLEVEDKKKLGKSDKDKTRERNLTKTDILKSLKLGLRTAAQAFDGLLALKFDENESVELIEQTLTQLAKSARAA